MTQQIDRLTRLFLENADDTKGGAGAADKADAGNKDQAGSDAAGADGNKDGQNAGDKGAGGAADKSGNADAAAAGAKKAPEKYVLTSPDPLLLDATDLKDVERVARENDWTNEEAQAAINSHIAALNTQANEFLATLEADATYGGANLEQTQILANKALDRIRPVGTPRGDAFRAMLTRKGYGNHLEVVSLLADLGKMLAEDKPGGHQGAEGGGQKKRAADVMYAETTSKGK